MMTCGMVVADWSNFVLEWEAEMVRDQDVVMLDPRCSGGAIETNWSEE